MTYITRGQPAVCPASQLLPTDQLFFHLISCVEIAALKHCTGEGRAAVKRGPRGLTRQRWEIVNGRRVVPPRVTEEEEEEAPARLLRAGARGVPRGIGIRRGRGRGLHSSTSQLNLSRVVHKNTPYTP